MAANKKTRSCPSCGQAFLKGRMVWRLLAEGAVRQRVCQSCAAMAMPVLACDAQARCQGCGTNLARYCGTCIGKAWEASHGATVVEMLATAAKSRGAKSKRVRGA